MFYKIVMKLYDMESGKYYYVTVADIDCPFVDISHIVKFPSNDYLLLECYPLTDEYVLSNHNLFDAEFDDSLEVK